MQKLLLNAVFIGVRDDAEVVAGVHAFDKDALDSLRGKLIGTTGASQTTTVLLSIYGASRKNVVAGTG
jgi:hypothetical protein